MVGPWSVQECHMSFTWRELESVHRIINTKAESLKGHSVVVYSDNKNVSHVLEVGSKKENLRTGNSFGYFSVNKYNSITLHPKWIPRTENHEADLLSKQTDRDDLGIDFSVYDFVCDKYGCHEIDAFATHYDTKCQAFYSKFWCPGTSGIDAFSFKWSNSNMWLVPLPALIPKTIQKCISENVVGTLVITKWVSAPFWPMFQTCKSFQTVLFCPESVL